MDPAERLLPGTITPHLATAGFARRIYYYPQAGSSNDVALELARHGEPEGTLVVTDFQRRGRGRRGHQWASREGRDLLFSLILRPETDSAAVLPVTLALSLGVAVAIQGVTGATVDVRWPNDLVVGTGKIGGILAEASHRSGCVEHLVVGLGVNVNSGPDDFPGEIRAQATSCRILTGAAMDRSSVLADVIAGVETYYQRFLADGFGSLAGAYNARLNLTGRQIRFRRGDARFEATVTEVGRDGQLNVRLEDGRTAELQNEVVEVVT